MAHWRFIYAHPQPISPSDLFGRGLGGSECAIVTLAAALAGRGHHVEVFTRLSCGAEEWEGVSWRSLEALMHVRGRSDVAVSVRYPASVAAAPASDVHLFWMLDERPDGAAKFDQTFGPLGMIVVASRAMENRLAGCVPRTRLSLIPHPVWPNDLPPVPRTPRSCLYSSVPDRGLDILLKMWPRIVQRVPSASLAITSGFELWGHSKEDPSNVSAAQMLASYLPLPGVTYLGVVPKRELFRLQRSSAALVYPCTFLEMFCLSVAEASAAGLPVVTSAVGALEERVIDGSTGFLVHKDVATWKGRRDFIDKVVRLLTDDDLRRRMGSASLTLAKQYHADTVTGAWEALCRPTA
jgi:glycosyltransferase involved in cell wall biosynthesis